MYFQKEPIFTVIIIAIGVGLYLFIKARNSGKGMFSFMGDNENLQQDRMNDVITLMMLQQLFSNNSTYQQQPSEKKQALKIDTTEKEIMALFERNYKKENENVCGKG
jgi:hypothetical protein